MVIEKKIKVLILGSRGQLGSRLSLLKEQNKLSVLTPSKKILDITNYKSLKKFIENKRPDVIINCAAYTKVDNASLDYNDTFKINIEGISNLCHCLVNKNILLIHFSSDYIFDGKKNTSYLEADKANPLSYYGFSKNIGELFIKYHLKKYFIFRISWLYSSEENNFLFKFIKLIKSNKKLDLISDNKGRPTSVNNIYVLINKILMNKNYNKMYGEYNLSDSGKVVSWYDLALYISKSLGLNKENNLKKCKISKYNFSEIRPKNSLFSLSKVKKNFNFVPIKWNIEFDKILKKYK